ncbi:MAG: PEFG-CTERM sorting domain-containing protein, partial [Nitrosopumilaceae archaeon]
PTSFAHQSGCHRWHSCPSDSGSYVCGDLGYYSQCPNNPSKSTESSQSSEPTKTQITSPQIQATESSSASTVKGTDYTISSLIVGGKILEIFPDAEIQSLVITVETISDGSLTIKLPREVIDAKIGTEDDEFFVLLDGTESVFTESKSSTFRTLTIEFPQGTEEILIIGTYVIPEFGSIANLVLAISILSIIVLFTKIERFKK